jgi:hypothetical protein
VLESAHLLNGVFVMTIFALPIALIDAAAIDMRDVFYSWLIVAMTCNIYAAFFGMPMLYLAMKLKIAYAPILTVLMGFFYMGVTYWSAATSSRPEIELTHWQSGFWIHFLFALIPSFGFCLGARIPIAPKLKH